MRAIDRIKARTSSRLGRRGSGGQFGLRGVLALAAVAFTLQGCWPEVWPERPDELDSQRLAKIRVIHLSPDAPPVDVFAFNWLRVFSDVEFGSGTDYLPIIPAYYDLNVTPAGASPSDAVLNIEGLRLEESRYYTAVAYGFLSEIGPLALVDDASGLDEGNLRVRAIHAASGVGQVDIWALFADGSAAALYPDFDYGQVGEYLDLPAGAYTLGFDLNDDAHPELIFDLPELPAGTVANVFAVFDGSAAYLVAQFMDGSTARIDPRPEPEPEMTEIRVLHLSPDAPPVDVLVNGELRAVSGLPFGEGTGYLSVEAGSYDFSVVPQGGDADTSVLDIPGLPLMADTKYTAVAYGFLSEIAPLALEDDASGLEDGNLRVRAIHAASGVGQVDIWALFADGSAAALYPDFDYGQVGEYLDLPAGAYTLGFDLNDDEHPELIFDLPELPAGTVANVFAVFDGAAAYLVAQFMDGSTARIDARPEPEPEPEYTEIRVLHLSPDAPPVDVLVDGELRAVSGLPYGQGTEYLSVEAGSYDFYVVPEGGDADMSVLFIPGLSLMADTKYTAVAYGFLSEIAPLALVDDASGLEDGNLRVRAIHAASGVGQVDIWALFADGSAAALYPDFDYGQVGEYLDLPAGAYTLGFDLNDDEHPELIFDLPELPAGTVANVFAVFDGSAAYLVAQFMDGSTARIDARPEPEPEPEYTEIRVLHLSPDAPPVDVLVNGELRAVSGLPFGEGTGYLSVEAGTYDFSVVPEGGDADTSVLDIPGLPLMADTKYTAVAYGFLSEIAPLALVDDASGLDEGNLRVRAIHAASGVGQVDIWALFEDGSAAALYPDFDYGQVGEYLDLPAGAYTLGFDLNDDEHPELIFDLPELPAGTVANVFAVFDGSAAYLVAQFMDGSTARIDARPEPEPEPEPAALRVFHLSPDAPPVDIFANGEGPIISHLAFGHGSARLSVPAGVYDIGVAPAGAGAEQSVLDVEGLALQPGMSYTAAAFDTLDSISAIALGNDLEGIPNKHARVRVVHTAVGVGPVDVQLYRYNRWWYFDGQVERTDAEQGLEFGVAGDEHDMRAGWYRLGLDLDADGYPDVRLPLGFLRSGQHINVFVSTGPNGRPFVKRDVQ